MFCFKKKETAPGLIIGRIAGEIGKGLMAGAAGTLAITLSQMIEMKITKREPSDSAGRSSRKSIGCKACNGRR